MTTHQHVHLTATELGSLWTQYQNDSLAACVLSHFLQNVDDEDIRAVLQLALHTSQNNISQISAILVSSGYLIPAGYTADDLNLKAGRLFLDSFYLHYLKHMSRLGLAAYTFALSLSARADARNFYQNCILSSLEIDKKVTDLMLMKGIFIRSPYIPPAKEIEFTKDVSYFGSIWGDKRYLNAIEISNLYANLQNNIMGETLITAFAQVVKTEAVRNYLLQGREIASKHAGLFTNALTESDLPASSLINTLITTSTDSPFSDKLILFHTTVLISAGLGNYGLSMSTSQRIDLTIDYARLMAEVGLYAKDGANLLIRNKWLEEPPQAINRRELAMSQK